jgi:hypothetical protein
LAGQGAFVRRSWRSGRNCHHREEIRLGSFAFRSPRFLQTKPYSLCLVKFAHNPLELSHLLHINPTQALLPASPCILLLLRALLIVSCKTHQLTLPIYS